MKLLDGLDWITAKCKAGLAVGVQEDCRRVIAALPEVQEELREEARRQEALERWTHTLIKCAEQHGLPRPEGDTAVRCLDQ